MAKPPRSSHSGPNLPQGAGQHSGKGRGGGWREQTDTCPGTLLCWARWTRCGPLSSFSILFPLPSSGDRCGGVSTVRLQNDVRHVVVWYVCIYGTCSQRVRYVGCCAYMCALVCVGCCMTDEAHVRQVYTVCGMCVWV